MLHPDPWQGIATECRIKDMEWIQNLGKNTWCDLWLQWPHQKQLQLPKDFNLYVVSFHLEAVDLKWLWQQSQHILSPIIVLTDGDCYDCPLPKNVQIEKFYWWHQQIECIRKWYPDPVEKQIKYQFSNVCNRITQSKLLITTALLELNTNSIIKLSTWKSPDAELTTGNKDLDQLHDIFYSKWYGKKLDLEDTQESFVNNQKYTSNPWTDLYQKCALHFTNESFHYSYMQDEFGNYIYPGPFITEKTLKCLVGATGFIPVGQFETYKALEQVGFKFDYDFTIDFDNDSGNISRLASIVKLLTEISTWNENDIYNATKQSSLYNQDHIYSNSFFDICVAHNLNTINKILDSNK
jgi:hypothetical protein